MPRPEPFRGEVWDVDFDDFGLHPAVVLSVNALNRRLGHVAVIPVTGARYAESYADVTGLQPVARDRLVARRGLLARRELDRLGRQVSIYLGL